MVLLTIDYAIAKPFIEQWHYSACVPKGKNVFFGWYTTENSLYAVANYGWGVNPYQEKFLSETTGYSVTRHNCFELKRLCRVEPKREDELTKFISECHRNLSKLGIQYIVSFSDPAYGHSGGIYKAASFTHLGKTNAEMHVTDVNGESVHRRVAYRHAKRNGITIAESRELLGLTRIKTQPKDRWFKVINLKASKLWKAKLKTIPRL